MLLDFRIFIKVASFTERKKHPHSMHLCKFTDRPCVVSLIGNNQMITEKQFTEMALSFPGTEQTPHFERTGFKVTGKRMFSTFLAENNTANIFLTPAEQKVFCKMSGGNIYPVPNKWGEKGATTFELNKVPKELIMEALLSAYNEVIKSGKKKR
jgi:hypothetical protein